MNARKELVTGFREEKQVLTSAFANNHSENSSAVGILKL